VSAGSGTADFCCSSTGGGSKWVAVAVEELSGTSLGCKEPGGSLLGRPSEASFGAGGTAERHCDPGARLGRFMTSAVASGVDVLDSADVGNTEAALRSEIGPCDCAGFASSVLKAVPADALLLIDAGGLERMELAPDRCDSGTPARTLKGVAVLGRAEAV